MPEEHTPAELPPELELLEVGEPLDEELHPIGSERSAPAAMDTARR
jgi:hypothetical protein